MTGGQPTPRNPWPLGDRLRAAREKQQLTQTAAAERADISRTVWQQLESGVRNDGRPFRPKASTVQSAAVAVGLDPRDALEMAGLDPGLFRPARGGPLASQREAADLFARLTGAQRQTLVEFLHTLVDIETADPEEAGETPLAGPSEQDDPTTPTGRAAMLARAQRELAEARHAVQTWEVMVEHIRQLRQRHGD